MEQHIFPMRLDKYLADMSVGTRKEVKKMIRSGRVAVDDSPAAAPEQKITEGMKVCLDGQPVIYQRYVYYLLNKPAGILTATRDRHKKTVLDLLDEAAGKNLSPCGRLDLDTEGLLLITNNGQLIHRLLSPAGHVAKTYYARIRGRADEEDIRRFAAGIKLAEDFTAMPAQLLIRRADAISEVEVTIYEGKFHQVKNMFEAVGKPVLYLRRISMGPLKLPDDLAPGCWRPLNEQEMAGLALLQPQL